MKTIRFPSGVQSGSDAERVSVLSPFPDKEIV